MIGLFFFLFLGLRAWDRLAHPQILSEDGRIFLTQAFEKGLGALATPYAGYYHTLPRLLAWVATLGDPLWAAGILTTSTFLVFWLLCERVCRADFSQIFSSPTERVCLALCLSFSPGLFEVLGNPTNVHWILTLYLGFLGLKNGDTPYLKRDVILGSLAIASGGECLVYLPLFAFRAWRQSRVQSGNFSRIGAAYFPFLIAVFAVLNFLSRDQATPFRSDFLRQLPAGLHYLWNNWFLLQPLVGDHGTELLGSRFAPAYWILSVGLSVLMLVRVWQQKIFRSWPARAVALFLAATLALVVMVWIARAEAFGIFAQITRDHGYSSMRYAFLVGPAALFFHLWWWPRAFLQLNKRQWAMAFTGLTFLLSSPRFFWGAHSPVHPTWAEKLEALHSQAALCTQNPVELSVWPEDWKVKIPRERLKAYCPSP